MVMFMILGPTRYVSDSLDVHNVEVQGRRSLENSRIMARLASSSIELTTYISWISHHPLRICQYLHPWYFDRTTQLVRLLHSLFPEQYPRNNNNISYLLAT